MDDYFVNSHGVQTPDAFWKVIIRGDGRAIGWLIDNSAEATSSNLDAYIKSLRELESITGENFPTDDFRKEEVPAVSWQIPIGCDIG